ncbi:hypothetical protein EPO05_03830 [Patescibacteria group bacterium]|nr:MAG: hypothetical protein EPO05_03830 [Patescibacteria group bacterium]
MKKQASLLWLLIILGGFFWLATPCQAADATGTFSYQPVEPIPGFSLTSDFPTFVTNLYKFGLWAVGISALIMITIGAFFYMTAAGNSSQAGTAKKIITDALIGLIVAMVAWLILYVINPNLVNINISITKMAAPGEGGGGGSGGGGTGTCTALQSGPCSESALKSSCFGSNGTKASGICAVESGGNTNAESGTDKCSQDGKSVSIGLFQINLTQHKVNGLDCPSAFTGGPYTSKNHDCKVVNESLYQQCVTAAKDSNTNIQKACEISGNGSSWSQWGANSVCNY